MVDTSCFPSATRMPSTAFVPCPMILRIGNHKSRPIHDEREELPLDFELHPPMALPEQVAAAPRGYVDATHGARYQIDAHRRLVWRLYFDKLPAGQAPQFGCFMYMSMVARRMRPRGLTLITVLSGGSILIHCRQGKRRSRAFRLFHVHVSVRLLEG